MENTKQDIKALNRKFMVEMAEEAGAGEGGTGNEGAQGAGEAGTGEGKQTKAEQHMIPKSRFDEVNNQFKTMKEQLDALLAEKEQAEQAKAKAEQDAMKEQGKFQDLYTQASEKAQKLEGDFTKTSERVQALESVINGLLDTKLESIPKDFHDLIPTNLSAEQRLAWVNQAEAKGLFGAKQQSTTPIGNPTNPSGKQTAVDVSQLSPMQKLKAGYGSK
jgi:hypothetical protein